MIRTPQTRKTFIQIAFLIWLFVPIADGLSLVLYTTILTPLNWKPMSFEGAYIDWQGFASMWLLVSPIVLPPIVFAAIGYSGSFNLHSFNRRYPLRSIFSWILYGTLAALSIFFAIEKQHLYELPKVLSSLLFAYLFLLCNAMVVNGRKNVAP